MNAFTMFARSLVEFLTSQGIAPQEIFTHHCATHGLTFKEARDLGDHLREVLGWDVRPGEPGVRERLSTEEKTARQRAAMPEEPKEAA